jgi:N4-gp56 family major capsid protein
MSHLIVPADMTVEQWDEKYYDEYVERNWLKKFEGKGVGMPIQVKEDLVQKPGTTVNFNLMNRVIADPLGENDLWEGQEQSVVFRNWKVTVHEEGIPLKWKEFEQQKTGIDLRESTKSALMTWNMERDRDKVIKALGNIPVAGGLQKGYADASEAEKDAYLADNHDRVLFGALRANNAGNDHSASLANIDNTSDKLSPSIIKLMKRMGKRPTTAAGVFLPTRPKVRPTVPRKSATGSDEYVFLCGTAPGRDLSENAEFQQMYRDAAKRGSDNPIFTGADYVVDNCAIFIIEDMPVYEGVGAGGIDVAPVYLLGAQALGKAWAKYPTTRENNFENEYGRFKGLGLLQWYNIEKLFFGSGPEEKDDPIQHGIVSGYVAAEPDA